MTDAPNLFPEMPAEEFAALKADIAKRGVLVPVVKIDGTIVDGHHRDRAARELGIECRAVDLDGDAREVAWALNGLRRHLSAEQRFALQLKAAERDPRVAAQHEQARAEARERQGTRTDLVAPSGNAAGRSRGPESSDRLGALAGVSGRTVRNVERVARMAPDRLAEVAAGKATTKEILREVRREEKERVVAEIAAAPAPPLRERYPVLCADPPWRYEHSSTPETRQIENHYPTMTLEAICALDPPPPAEDDAVLFLWATSPKLTEALRVMEAWGFEYRTNLVWVKDRIGMGYYARQQHEMLLVGRRGAIPHPDEEDRPSSVLQAPRREHSEKPDEAYALIERMYPTLPRVEMFARKARPRWAAWGNQAPVAA